MSHFTAEDHTFVICAYRESRFLEECIISLKKQSVQGNIIITTATPNEYIRVLAQKYQLPLYCNLDGGEISKDWNYGISKAATALVTIAHQDDYYESDYLKRILEECNREKTPLIAFTDYGELRDNKKDISNSLLRIKELMLLPLRPAFFRRSRFIRRRILSFGSPICCPSVTYVKCNLQAPFFREGYRSDLDWQAWEKFSRQKGSFVYCHEKLMFHRIHEESATTKIIGDNDRSKEDYEMFCQFWPRWIAGIIERFYQKSEQSNNLD